MGQSESKLEHHDVPIEQLSHELALRFATKCYSHLEIAHFKDNFKTLADHQDDIEYWKEETLCRFLSLPDAICVGSVLYAAITYLGAFPFPSLAPCIVTREAMLKVVTLLTGRYKRILKRGEQDKIKLLFKSLAVFDRRNSSALLPAVTKETILTTESEVTTNSEALKTLDSRSVGHGFAIDQPLNDDEEEDDDDLALAALDALDAIEVFKEDHRQDRKIHHAHIPVYNFERLLMLLLLLAPLTPQDNIAQVCGALTKEMLDTLEQSARCVIRAFDAENEMISYSNFINTMTTLTPQLFRTLSPLFEHFLFSKQLDLNKHLPDPTVAQSDVRHNRSPLIHTGEASSQILNDILLAQLSTSFEIGPTPSSTSSSFFHTNAQLNQLYSTASHGTSLSSFSRQVTSWRSASLLILKGTTQDEDDTPPELYILGAYLSDPWQESNSSHSSTSKSHTTTASSDTAKPILFQLSPRHATFRANPSNHNSSSAIHFSTRTGISLGAILSPPSRLSSAQAPPISGPVSLLIDSDVATATFTHDGDAGTGAYLTDPLLEESQRRHSHAQSSSPRAPKAANTPPTQSKKIILDIDGLEVWGISFTDPDKEGGDDEITRQKKRLAWEEAEAARRRGVNFGGDKDGARHLLEMAGIISGSGARSGGSV